MIFILGYLSCMPSFVYSFPALFMPLAPTPHSQLLSYLDGLNAVQNPLGNTDTNNVLLETGIGLDGHDTGDDGTVDASLATLTDPVQELGDIKEQLSDNEVGTSVDLLLEELQVFLHRSRLRVLLGVASHTNAKVVAMGLADVANQVGGVVETALAGGPLRLTVGWVTTQGQDVLVATCACFL